MRKNVPPSLRIRHSCAGNPLGSDGASALLFALQDSGCSLIAQGVCVRPETPVHLLLSQAASGEGIGLEDLQQAGVDTLAARALLEGSDAIREAQKVGVTARSTSLPLPIIRLKFPPIVLPVLAPVQSLSLCQT